MAAPETDARQALIAMLNTEFAPEGFPVKDDDLHESLGFKGTIIGVSPERSVPNAGNLLVNEIEIKVQFYGKYDLKIDPKQSVSPATIETYADRFRTALRTHNPDPHTGRVWYFNLTRIEFPRDATGNRTRFEAFVVARGNNSALVETS